MGREEMIEKVFLVCLSGKGMERKEKNRFPSKFFPNPSLLILFYTMETIFFQISHFPFLPIHSIQTKCWVFHVYEKLTNVLPILVEDGYVWEKLYCMGCKARLGSFNWAGMQCSCGAWVNPAFQLVKSKIDECQF
ncbi:unnamed protein product [Amaranthus hypochondriacus]